MKKLLVDIGNTRIKSALMNSQGELEPVLYCDSLTELERLWTSLSQPDSIWVSSVVNSQNNKDVQTLCQRLWSVAPEFLKTSSQAFNVTNGYLEPDRLGVDRWLAILAAYQQSKTATLIVDAGSVLTIDAVDKDGHHLGGWLLPGLRKSIDALIEAGSFGVDLNAITLHEDSVFGKTTEQGLNLGVRYSAIAAIERAYSELKNLSPDLTCYLTGGDALQLGDALQFNIIYDENLVLKGVALFAARNMD